MEESKNEEYTGSLGKSGNGKEDWRKLEDNLRKWTKRKRRRGEMLGGFIWTSADLIIFLGREKYMEKALCLSGTLATSQLKLNVCYGVIRLTTQLPRICLRDI